MFCVHIGLPKTGTTTLQKHLFEKHPDVTFLGLFGHKYRDPRLEQLVSSIRLDPAGRYNADLSRELLQASVPSRADAQHTVLLSDARLTQRVNREKAHIRVIKEVDDETIARRLRDLFGRSKILITIRSQYDLLWSWYLHDRRNIIIQPDRWIEAQLNDGDVGRLGALKYDELVERYRRLFEPENVGFFALEEMKADVEGFARKLSAFLGINGDESARLLTGQHENVRASRRMLLYHRLRYRFFPNVDIDRLLPERIRTAGQWFLRRGQPTIIKTPDDWRPLIHDLYRESNRRMCDLSGLPLEKYGYPI